MTGESGSRSVFRQTAQTGLILYGSRVSGSTNPSQIIDLVVPMEQAREGQIALTAVNPEVLVSEKTTEKTKEQRTCIRCSLACTLPQVLRQSVITG